MKRTKISVPSFLPFRPASEATSRAKQRNRSRDTRAEVLLRQSLSKLQLRYRLHCSDIAGKPDVAFRGAKLAVFCDGDFWHGRHWAKRRSRLESGANAAYWVKKIEYNIERDKKVARRLRAQGWSILRFWESDIIRAPDEAVRAICQKLLGHEGLPPTV